MEQWTEIKQITKVGSQYLVSDLGRIKIIRNGKEKIILGHLNGSGYRLLKHTKNVPSLRVHQLVLLAFTEKPKWAQCVNHKNSDRADNRLVNLEWATFKSNAQHAYDTGRRQPVSGNDNKRAIDIGLVHQIYDLKKLGIRPKDIVRRFSELIGATTVTTIFYGKSWKREYKKHFSCLTDT